MSIIITLINGFCMALADSVPGVSGGTVAFLMGFYDNFVGALDDIISGDWSRRKRAAQYLFKLVIGWVVGFSMAVFILSSVFEPNIYRVSSLFLGFIIFAVSFVVFEEKVCLIENYRNLIFLFIGIAVVVSVTYFNPIGSSGNSFSFGDMNILMYLYVFSKLQYQIGQHQKFLKRNGN